MTLGTRRTSVLVFDLRGSIAHFRRPDTTATHASYPFITRTALRGLLGAVLGLDEWLAEDAWTGVQLLGPVRTRVQQLALLGKEFLGASGGKVFSRPTAIELVVEPRYRVYYSGAYMDELEERLIRRQSVYPTYLGSAFCLTVPEWVGRWEVEEIPPDAPERVEVVSVVPSHAVDRLELTAGVEYGRMGGVLYRYLGGRRFRGSINLIYEVQGAPIALRRRPGPYDPPVRWVALSHGQVVALW